ncbi:MAG: porin [Myxococcota bacterium]
MHPLASLPIILFLSAPAAAADKPGKAPEKTTLPTKLSVADAGSIQPGLLLQGQVSTQTAPKVGSVRLRRMELSLKGEFLKLIGVGVMVDPSRALEAQKVALDGMPAPEDAPAPGSDVNSWQTLSFFQANGVTPTSTPGTPGTTGTPWPGTPTSPVGEPNLSDGGRRFQLVGVKDMPAMHMVQDVYMSINTPVADVGVGQFKMPLSMEGFGSSSKLVFAERAPSSTTFGDRRDLGLRVSKNFKYAGYYVGVFNGASLRELDKAGAKYATTRLELYPVKGLTFAGAGAQSFLDPRSSGSSSRLEADARWEVGRLLLQGELIGGRDVNSERRDLYPAGGYAMAAFNVWGGIQPAMRLGFVDPNLLRDEDPAAEKGRDEMAHMDLGLNWMPVGHLAKLQLTYSRLQYQQRRPDNQVFAMGQLHF